IGELVVRRAAVVSSDRVAARLGREARLGSARADHDLDRLEHLPHAHTGPDVPCGPLATLLRDLPGMAVAFERVCVHESRHSKRHHGPQAASTTRIPTANPKKAKK